ncbi:MAG: hypothetical protein JSV89_18895 [Spirochaetaceae bacterium]|nr:MAG: hypothetical protein JSV89_18895 [Spirochaetaceae bacterium]
MRPWIAFPLILLLGLVSCARGDKTEKSASPESTSPPVQAVENNAGEVVSKREITLTQAAPSEQPQPSTTQQSEQQRLLTIESAQVLPEDFKIGPLADLVGIERSAQEMVSVTTRFLNALQEGTVLGDSLHNSVRQELSNSINYYLQRELVPVNYRIGSITTESKGQGDESSSVFQNRTAWMNIRLFGSPGVCEGELYLDKSGGRWYVSDVQIDFETMNQDYVREKEKYYPSTYGWEIQ